MFVPASVCDRGVGRLALAAVLVLGLSVVGCVRKPTMTLHHAEISGVSIGFPPSLGVLLTVVVSVDNPNTYDVAVRAVRGRVVFANRYPLPVDFKAPGEGAWLPSNVTTLVRVPVDVPVGLATTMLEQSYLNPVIPFRFTGRADVTATRTFKLEVDNYAVDEQGYVSRQQIESVLHGTIRVGRFAPHAWHGPVAEALASFDAAPGAAAD